MYRLIKLVGIYCDRDYISRWEGHTIAEHDNLEWLHKRQQLEIEYHCYADGYLPDDIYFEIRDMNYERVRYQQAQHELAMAISNNETPF